MTHNYITPNNTPLTTVTTATSGTESLAPVTSGPVMVTAQANWSIAKGVVPGTPPRVLASPNYQYTYSVSMPYAANQPLNGRLNMENLVLKDTLPANAIYVSSTENGTYDAATHTVTWVIPDSINRIDRTQYGSDGINSASAPLRVTIALDPTGMSEGDVVTNHIAFTANPFGDPSTNLTGSYDFPYTTTLVPTGAGDLGKTNYGQEVSTAGGTEIQHITVANKGTSALSGTMTEIFPCMSSIAATSHTTDLTGGPLCTNPTDTLTSLRIQKYNNGDTSQITWWTTTGVTGTYIVPANVDTVTPSDMGVPAGGIIAKFTADVSLPAQANANVRFSMTTTTNTALNVGDTVTNIATASLHDSTATYNLKDDDTYTIRAAFPTYNTDIVDAAGLGISYLPGQQIKWDAKYTLRAAPSGDNADATPDWYVAIPQGLKYVDGSVNYTDLANIGGVKPELVEVIPGTGNLAGSSLLHLRWPTSAVIKGFASTVTKRPISIDFLTVVDSQAPAGVYNTFPPAMGQPATTKPNSIVSAAFARGYTQRGSISDGWQYFDQYFPNTDTADFNANTNNTETMASRNASWSVSPGAVAYVNLGVIGDTNVYGSMAHTSVMGDATYQFNFLNASNNGAVLTDMVMYQTMPRVGDTYISENSGFAPRGSAFNVYLRGHVTAPAGVQVQYSTAANPCRPEVHTNNSGCDATWVSSVTDWSTVTAIKFFFPGNYNPGAGETISEPVTTDGSATPGEIAWKSIAYRATNATTGTFLVPAETPRVGLIVDPLGLVANKTVDKPEDVALKAGEDLNYTVTVKNNGAFPLAVSTLNIAENISELAPYATYKQGTLKAVSSIGAVVAQPTINGTSITWTGALAVGETVTVTYTFVVKDGVPDDARLTNHLTASGIYEDGRSVASNCMLGTETGCTVTNRMVSTPKPVVPPTTPLANTGSNTFVRIGLGAAAVLGALVALARRRQRLHF